MLVFQIFRYSCQTSQGTSETTCCYWEFENVYSSLSLLLSNRIKTLDEGKDLLRLCNKYYSNHKNAVTTSTSIFLCSSTRQSLSSNRYLPFQSWGNESTLWSNWMYAFSSLFLQSSDHQWTNPHRIQKCTELYCIFHLSLPHPYRRNSMTVRILPYPLVCSLFFIDHSLAFSNYINELYPKAASS